MKNSIAHLSGRKQKDLKGLVETILERIPETEMIILYGSYATDKYVEYDSRVEFGIRTVYMSDYDLLVATNGIADKQVARRLGNIEEAYYKRPDEQTPVQFINEDIKTLNKYLSEGRYFYTQLKKEGIFLYNSGNFKLARRKKLKYDEIRKQAQSYYEEKYKEAEFFFDDVITNYEKERYKRASFHLHQTCENLFHAVRLTYTLMSSKQHNLGKLLASVKRYSDEFQHIFPRKTEEEKKLFDLIKAAYVEARYNPGFVVSREDIDAFKPLVERLFKLVKDCCEKRIEEYGEME